MKFMVTFNFKPETKARDEAIARFKRTGGQPPKGVKLLGRWTAADFSGGFDQLENEPLDIPGANPKKTTALTLSFRDTEHSLRGRQRRIWICSKRFALNSP